MNKEQRKTLAGISETIYVAMEQVAHERDAEQEKFDNLPESLQSSNQGEWLEDAIQHLNDAYDELDRAYESIQESMGVEA